MSPHILFPNITCLQTFVYEIHGTKCTGWQLSPTKVDIRIITLLLIENRDVAHIKYFVKYLVIFLTIILKL